MYAPFRGAILNVDFYDDLRFFIVVVHPKSTDIHRYGRLNDRERYVNEEKCIGENDPHE